MGFKFAKDPEFLWTRKEKHSAVLWDLRTGEASRHIQPSDPDVQGNGDELKADGAILFSPKGKFAVQTYTATDRDSIRLIAAVYKLPEPDTDPKTVTPRPAEQASSGTKQVSRIGFSGGQFFSFSPDGQRAVVVGYAGAIVLDPLKGVVTHRLDFPENFGPPRSADWSTDGQTLAAVGPSRGSVNSIVVWNKNFEILRSWELPRGGGPDRHISVSPDGSLFALVNEQGRLRVVNGLSGEIEAEIPSAGRAAAFSPDGETIAAIGSRTVLYCNLDGAKRTARSLPQTDIRRSQIAFSIQRGIGMYGGGQDKVVIWEMRTGKILDTWNTPLTYVRGLALSPQGNFAAVWPGAGNGVDRPVVHVYSIDKGELHSSISIPAPTSLPRITIYSVAFSPDNRTLLTSDSVAVGIWRLPSSDDPAGEQ